MGGDPTSVTQVAAVGDVQLVLRLALGGLLLFAAIGHLRSFGDFVLGLQAYDLVPPRFVTVAAGSAVAGEIVSGGLLLSGLAPVLASVVAATLFTAFLIGVVVNLLRRRAIDCHCFDAVAAQPIGVATVVRLILLIAAAITLAATTTRVGQAPASAPLPAALLALGVALLLVEIGSIRQVIAILRAPVVRSTRDGGRISLRHAPRTAGLHIERRPQ